MQYVATIKQKPDIDTRSQRSARVRFMLGLLASRPSSSGSFLSVTTFFTFACIAWCLLMDRAARAQEVDFNTQIRPLLSDKCFRCHGPDEDTREAGLRLDIPEWLDQDMGENYVVTPYKPDDSELIQRVYSTDTDLLMPPPGSNKSLSASEKELLSQWIKQGATWEQHWSFVQPVDHKVPAPKDSEEALTEIDQFLLVKLKETGLGFSPLAKPHSIVRRLYLDLIGLPPAPETADSWIAKIWPNGITQPSDEVAYQELVSSLLDSSHYGERWGKKWLDLARYADTNGYEKDRDRSIWPYRDWVVNALNADMPFDQFSIEQLAGDMLPNATLDQRVATGFHRNTMLNEEGGIDPLEFRFRAVTDRVATTGTTWLGLTLGCCQCHTHKYDPISHTEYFQVMAYLNNVDEPSLELPTESFEQKWAANRKKALQLLAQLPQHWPLPKESQPNEAPTESSEASVSEHPDPDGGEGTEASNLANQRETQLREEALQSAFANWLSFERANCVEWRPLEPVRTASNLPILTVQSDHSIFASGDTAKRDDYYITFAPDEKAISAIQLEALPDERLPARGPGSTYYEGTLGDFFLTELVATVDGEKRLVSKASHSYAKNRFGSNPAGADLAIDGDVQTGWSVHERQGERHVAVFEFAKPIQPGQELKLQMTFGRHFASSLGKFRVNGTDSGVHPQARDHSDEVVRVLRKPEPDWSDSERQVLMDRFLLTAPELKVQAAAILKLQARPQVDSTLVITERPKGEGRKTQRHHRGEYLQPQEEVSPGLPNVLASNGIGPLNRLEFAKWIVSKDNPLTARVVVNRTWAAFFGNGIVKSLDDFGLQGESPSHPKLLDWLAIRFMTDDGWSMKRLHRRIVTSRAYRQSSAPDSNSKRLDNDNRLLSYFPRVRLEAEILRDCMLTVSGRLNTEMGGPPVKPLQPAGVTELAYGSKKWQASAGNAKYRRSIYTYMKRTAPFAMLATFDAPSGESCIAQRNRSNSPLQALTLLNDVMIIDLARHAGKRYSNADSGGELNRALTSLFRNALIRKPTRAELEMLRNFYQTQLARLRTQPKLSRELMGLPDGKEDPKADSKSDHSSRKFQDTYTHAAWTATARAIFGLDEFQTRE